MTEPPIVMHVIPGLGPGGAEGMLAALVAAKRATPFRQVVVNLMPGGSANTDTIRAAGVPIHNLNLVNPAMGIPAVVSLAQLIRQYRPAAIQSWLYLGDLVALWALKASGLRRQTRLYWGVRCSDMDLSQYNFNLRLVVGLCTWQSRAPDAVISNSHAGRDVHQRMGYRPKVFGVIPNGIDTVRFRPNAEARTGIRAELGIDADTPIVLHAARFDRMKDHATSLAVAAQMPEVTFVYAGKDTETISGSPNVIALGTRRDMPTLYAAADAGLLTSAYGEGFPNVIAEAMACGVPAVATDSGDSARIIGSTGQITSRGDVPALVSALKRILAVPHSDRTLQANACRQRIEQLFSLNSAVAAFDRLHMQGEFPDA